MKNIAVRKVLELIELPEIHHSFFRSSLRSYSHSCFIHANLNSCHLSDSNFYSYTSPHTGPIRVFIQALSRLQLLFFTQTLTQTSNSCPTSILTKAPHRPHSHQWRIFCVAYHSRFIPILARIPHKLE